MPSPTARSLEEARKRKWLAHRVEYWNAFSKRRVDLFGFLDLVALDSTGAGCIGIQATTTENMWARIEKIKFIPAARTWLERKNKIFVWGWAKRGDRGKRKLWTLKEREVVLSDLHVINHAL